MNDTDGEEKVTVNKVCQDFRVREDGALANKLQEEEFQKHYGMNRNERKSVRTDVRVAKQTYLEEIKTAQLLPQDELCKMEETDKWLARDLQDKLHDEERRAIRYQQEIETHDAKVAKQLQIREKEKFDREWRRKKEEEERRHMQRTVEELNHSERDSRRSPVNPVSEPISINGHTDGVQRRVRRTNSKEDKRRSTGSGSSGGSVGKEERRQKPSPDYGSGSSGGSVGKEERRRQPLPEYGSGRSVGKEERRRKASPDYGSGSGVGKEERRKKPSPDYGNGAVVALPPSENGGGRLESDRIIMADGTAIDLFDNEEDREKALRMQRVKKDEEYAKMLQDQERRIVEAEKMAAEDRRFAMEEQDRELARHLQRKEYQRLKREQKERQMQRANSVPSDRHSVSIEDPRRLPSYEEAVHRTQMPDLLPDHDFDPENLHERDPERSTYSSTRSSRSTASQSPPIDRRTTNPDKAERREYKREEGRISARGPSSVDHRRSVPVEDRRLEKEYSRNRGSEYRETRAPSPTRNGHPSGDYRMDSNEHRKRYENIEKEHHRYDHKEGPVWLARDSVCSSNSPPRERHEFPENNHGSSRLSYASSGQSSCDRRSQTSGHAGSPSSRADVWERFDDDESLEETRNSRPSRSRTVASSHPGHYERERPKSYNVVENIDPTFKRERKGSEDDAKEEQGSEEKAKVIPLIKPHRRKSVERKRDRHADKENCKQQ